MLLLFAACSAKDGTAGSSAPGGSNGQGTVTGSGGKSSNRAGASNAGGASKASGSTDVACATLGATRPCCGSGLQTCSGTPEFASWGACRDKAGELLECHEQVGCGKGEFATACDVLDAGHPGCAEGEFTAGCDAGTSLCTNKKINNEAEILAAYEPADGETVGRDGQIKVWVNDEWAAFIAPGEQVDNATGEILAAGDRSMKSHDGFLYEPALYIAPNLAEKGGTPHFPRLIKGWYNNAPPATKPMPKKGVTLGTQGAAVDPAPTGTKLREPFTTELVWDVAELGLAPGSYFGQFVIGDGDYDRAIGCVVIKID